MNPQEPGYYDWLRKMVDSNLPPIAVAGPLHDPVVTTSTARRSDHAWDGSIFDKSYYGPWVQRNGHEQHKHIHTAIYDEAWGFADKQKESSMNRTEVITAELARLQNELATRSKFGEDTYDEASVLKFKADFNRTDGHVYFYAAIKAGGFWHVTGARSESSLTWSQLVDFFIKSNTTKVWGMVKTERIV